VRCNITTITHVQIRGYLTYVFALIAPCKGTVDVCCHSLIRFETRRHQCNSKERGKNTAGFIKWATPFFRTRGPYIVHASVSPPFEIRVEAFALGPFTAERPCFTPLVYNRPSCLPQPPHRARPPLFATPHHHPTTKPPRRRLRLLITGFKSAISLIIGLYVPTVTSFTICRRRRNVCSPPPPSRSILATGVGVESVLYWLVVCVCVGETL